MWTRDQADIDDVASRLDGVEWVAVDTEFVRESTYYPKLCLLQLGTPDWCVLVDPLADVDLTPIWQMLYRPELRKVFHAASQDLEIFSIHRDCPPPNLFDTQIAAPLLGYDEGIGYARLVEKITGVVLSKDQTRTDWSRRPLPEAAQQYAADDVVHLAAIYPQMVNELDRTGRAAWLQSNWLELEDVRRYRRDDAAIVHRLKGLDRLSPAQQARAQSLALWREESAQREDTPRGWLLSDREIYTIARKNPKDVNRLRALRELNPKTVEKYADMLISTVSSAPEEPAYPVQLKRKRIQTDSRRALVDTLQREVERVAECNGINAHTLATRGLLDQWLDNPAAGFEPSWRNSLLDDALKATLAAAESGSA